VFVIKEKKFELMDIGSQRSERLKWPQGGLILN
jgi:hypothetical protein